MSNAYFQFKEFTIRQDKSAMKVGTDSMILGALADYSKAKTVLDIGTGTGILSLMAAQMNPHLTIDAIESDRQSYLQALENKNATKWKTSINIVSDDIKSFAKSCPKKYDVIVSNPPYFENSKISQNISRTNARHTSQLSPGDILKSILRLLNNDGQSFIIYPFETAKQVILDAYDLGLYCNKQTIIYPRPDSNPIRNVIELSFKKASPIINTLYIRCKDGNYSTKFKKLTRNFYSKSI